MDRLFARYADPFSFISGMIRTGRFREFVESMWNTDAKERNDREIWEFFLHRVFNKSFDDFKEELRINAMNSNMSERTIETTIKHSMNILQNFNPEKGGEAVNGIIQTSGNDCC